MYTLKNLEQIANEQLHGKTDTLVGIQRKLTAWFCLTLNTTPTDPRLLDMTLEELIVFYLTHKISTDPDYVPESEKDDYEAWLKKEMGEDYVSEEAAQVKLENEEKVEEKNQETKRKPGLMVYIGIATLFWLLILLMIFTPDRNRPHFYRLRG